MKLVFLNWFLNCTTIRVHGISWFRNEIGIWISLFKIHMSYISAGYRTADQFVAAVEVVEIVGSVVGIVGAVVGTVGAVNNADNMMIQVGIVEHMD